MDYYSLPADFQKKTIDLYAALNQQYADKKIEETYGQITIGANFSSGRYISELPRIDMHQLSEYIEYSYEKGIGFNYTLNAPFMNNMEFQRDGIEKILGFLQDLHRIGIRSLTISLPTLYEIIRASGLDFKIKASTICQINSVNKAMFYKNKGYGRIVLDESIYRDFDLLQRIVASYGDGVEIIINSLCNQNCAYRMFHYNQTSADAFGNSGISFYAPRCAHNLLSNPNNIMQLSWIRPEDLHYYRGIGIRFFKLQGREYAINGSPERAVKAYFDESYEGNLMNLLDLFSSNFKFKFFIDNRKLDGFLDGLYANRDRCHHDCNNCRYCDEYARKSIETNLDDDLILLTNEEQFKKIDRYQNLLFSIVQEQETRNAKKKPSVEFDI